MESTDYSDRKQICGCQSGGRAEAMWRVTEGHVEVVKGDEYGHSLGCGDGFTDVPTRNALFVNCNSIKHFKSGGGNGRMRNEPCCNP